MASGIAGRQEHRTVMTPKSSQRPRTGGAPGDPPPPRKRSAAARDALANEVLAKAVQLFADRGVAGTTLKDVADAIGLSRTAIYHYFPSKEALLETLVAEVSVTAARIFDDVRARSDLAPLARVREAARELVLWATSRRLEFRLMDRSENELPPLIAKHHGAAKRHVLRGMIELIDDAIRAGEARPVDSQTAAFAIIGMCNWTAWWYAPGHAPAAGIADQISGMAVQSLALEGTASTKDIPALADGIREALRLIEIKAQPG
jgi:AcrR family transcriptional regulator